MPANEPSLKDATLTGVRWVVLARVASEVLALAGVVVLARLIPPAAFGRAAVALILVPLATILTFEGFASALVQRKACDERHRESAMFTSLLGGIAMSGLTLLLAGPVAGPLFGEATATLVRLISPVFLLASIGAVSRAMLWRALDFRRTGLIDVAALFAGTVTAVGLAVGGADATAIVAGALAQATATTVLLLVAAPPPRPRRHAREQRQISAFGLPAALAGLVGVLFTNVDYAIVAARAGALQAGIYWRAFQIGVGYQEKVSRVMMQLAFPVYSRTTDPAQLRELHERATKVHAVVLFPLLALVAICAPVLVPVVFGPAWVPAVAPTQILCSAGAIAAVLTGYPQVMLAIGRPRPLLVFNVATVVLFATVVALTVGRGLVVLSLGAAGVYVLVMIGAYRFLLQPYAGIPLRNLPRELGPAVVGCAGLGVAGEGVFLLLRGAHAPGLVVLLGTGLAGGAAYVLTVRTLFRPVYADVLTLGRRVLPHRRPAFVSLRRQRPAAAVPGPVRRG